MRDSFAVAPPRRYSSGITWFRPAQTESKLSISGFRMSLTRTLPLSCERSGATRVVFVCQDLQRVSSYYEFLESEGFEVLVAFDVTTALDVCRRSIRPVKAAVVLTNAGADSVVDGGELVRGLSNSAPRVPCIVLPAASSPQECAVLISTAVRCTTATYLASA